MHALRLLSLGATTVLLPVAVLAQGGPTDRPPLDQGAAMRGKRLYTAHCINCHGSTAKGGPDGPDLIRSAVVLRDRLGSGIGPAMRATPASHPTTLTAEQILDLSHFLRERIEAVARNRSPRGPINVLTGNPEAGRIYFNAAGRCHTCHSPAGDFKGLRSRISDALTLQRRFLFPTLTRTDKQVEVTVTPASAPSVSGQLVRIDNFTVSLRGADGEYRSFSRMPGVAVVVHDPLAVHHELLDEYTDEVIHDVYYLYEDENDDKPQGWGGNDRGGWSEAMLLGLDFQTGKARWQFKWDGSATSRSGLLATAGNLLFAGDAAGNFVAFNAARGQPLWHAGLHASITNGPITYQLDGIQYVVVAANDTLYAFASPRRATR